MLHWPKIIDYSLCDNAEINVSLSNVSEKSEDLCNVKRNENKHTHKINSVKSVEGVGGTESTYARSTLL